MSSEKRSFHRTKDIVEGDEIVTIGYYWEVDQEPFVGGHLVERSIVLARRPRLKEADVHSVAS